MEPTNRECFLAHLMGQYGAPKGEWSNNNQTLHNSNAYIVEVTCEEQVAAIIREVFNWNKTDNGKPIVTVPVAGWNPHEDSISKDLSFISEETRAARLTNEYAKSFSLAPWATAPDADIIFRFPPEFQRRTVISHDNTTKFIVTPGVRITDADKYLSQHGLAMAPNNSTLHVSSLIGGAATGSYGPTRDHGPMASYILQMKVITPTGDIMTLSETENAELFHTVRDCHLGAGFIIIEMVLGGITQNYKLERTHQLFQDIPAVRKAMKKDNPLKATHFIGHYIPVAINAKVIHAPRFRLTTMEPTEKPSTGHLINPAFSQYCDMTLANAADGLIIPTTVVPELRRFFPLVLEAASLKTFGLDKHVEEVGEVADMLHMLKTYTDAPIADINWLIQVENREQGRDLLVQLLEKVEQKLIECGKNKEYPLFTAFCRYNKGIYYPEGKGGIAPAGIDNPDQGILAFELLTYSGLSETQGYKDLVQLVIDTLEEGGFKYRYQPGKTPPANINTIDAIYRDRIDQARVAKFKRAIEDLHGNVKHIAHSPFLTPEKKAFFGWGTWENVPKRVLPSTSDSIGVVDKKRALEQIVQHATTSGKTTLLCQAKELLSHL